MNCSKNTIFAIALTALFTITPSFQPTTYAQGRSQHPRHQQPGPQGHRDRPDFNPTEFRAKVREFITREAKLTPQQADIVFPIFFEIKDRQRELHRKIGKACQRVNTEHLSERDCERILTGIQQMQRQLADLDRTLTDRLRQRGIPASKILAIKAADDQFRRTTFRNATHRRK